MEIKKERVVLITRRHRIVGDLHLPREGYLSRFSDFLNRNELRFISLTDVEITDLAGSGSVVGDEEQQAFIAIGSDHVELAYPCTVE